MASALVGIGVRWLHVLGMALVLGGAVLTWGHLRFFADATRTTREQELGGVWAYEWLFWGSIGILIMTGVGNLGALAPRLPAPESSWGMTLSIKLLAILGFLLLSIIRLLGLHAYGRVSNPAPRVRQRLQWGYGLTALYVGGLLVLAEVLAHG